MAGIYKELCVIPWEKVKNRFILGGMAKNCPLYAKAVENTDAYQQLKDLYQKEGQIWLWDFDSYDYAAKGMTLEDVINCDSKKCGHGFILAMMLQDQRFWLER